MIQKLKLLFQLLITGQWSEFSERVISKITGRQYIQKHEFPTFLALARIVSLTGKSGTYVVDVGCSNGLFLRALSRFVKILDAIGYEPLPDGWPELRLGSLASRCRIRNVAVGATTGEIELFQTVHPGLSSALPLEPTYHYYSGNQDQVTASRKVEIVTLDDEFVELPNWPTVLKIDTQGYEMEVLRGAERLLASGRIAAIVLEVSVRLKYQNQPLIEEIITSLRGYGYQIYQMSPGYVESTGQVSEYDIVFCHEGFLEQAGNPNSIGDKEVRDKPPNGVSSTLTSTPSRSSTP
ncbi:MAG: FkbM family methyltransferase [Gemmataceae bacterium]